jgi:hypothetical protein
MSSRWCLSVCRSIVARLLESWERKIWSWVPRDSEPRMTVLERAAAIYPNDRSVCLSVCLHVPALILEAYDMTCCLCVSPNSARQSTVYDSVSPLISSFSMRSVSCQRKVVDQFLPELRDKRLVFWLRSCNYVCRPHTINLWVFCSFVKVRCVWIRKWKSNIQKHRTFPPC